MSSFFLPSFLLSVDTDLHLTTLAFLPLLRAGGERVTLGGERHRWTASGTDEMPRGERQRIFTSSLSSKAKCLVTLHRRLEIILSTIACERQICFCLVLLEIGLVTGSHMPEAEIRLFSPLSNETLHGVLGSVTQTRVCNPATTPDHHTAVGTRDHRFVPPC
jgi:hypothetical protein